MGDGFEFVAVVPFGFVFFALVAPSLFLGSTARRLPLGAALSVAGLMCGAIFQKNAEAVTHFFVESAQIRTNQGRETTHCVRDLIF
jgi:ammonia channel protein AmtB